MSWQKFVKIYYIAPRTFSDLHTKIHIYVLRLFQNINVFPFIYFSYIIVFCCYILLEFNFC